MRHPFAIANLLDKSYAVPGWFPVPKDTLQKDLIKMKFEIKEEPKLQYNQPTEIEKLVSSSSGSGKYTVKFNGAYWSCTCKGYAFRRSCRHIEEVKNDIKQK